MRGAAMHIYKDDRRFDGGNNGQETPPHHWFCVALMPDGQVMRKEAESPATIKEVLARAAVAWVDCWVEDAEKDTVAAASGLGFSEAFIIPMVSDPPTTYQDFDTEMGVRLPSVHVKEFDVRSFPLYILLRQNFVLTVHPLSLDGRFTRLRRYSDTVLRRIPSGVPVVDKLTYLVIRIIDENNDRNFDQLRKIEEKSDDLNEDLVDPDIPRNKIGPEIYRMKHALINYLDTLWETLDVLHALHYGDAELVTNDDSLLDRLGMLVSDVSRQISLSEHMSDVLASGLEVLQSIYNNQLQILNNRMALVMTYLTILGTAVLVPNTLATVLSNPAFNMDSGDRVWYSILIVVSTVAATLLAYWWVKRKKWLPPKLD